MLTDRQQLILRVIVDDFIASAEPVGSRTIAKHKEISYSPATIRNDMADLEEMGYLEQPHTSAGRIPSQKGYRFYVDNFVKPVANQKLEADKIRELFQKRFMEMDQSIRQAAVILSELTNYTAIILGPEIFQTKLRQVQIIPLDQQKAVAILVTDTGTVENKVITIPPGISINQVEQMVNLINHRLRGVTLAELPNRLFSEFADEMRKNLEQYTELSQMINQLFVSDQGERIFLGGTTQILSQPEFRDIEKAKNLFQLFENSDLIVQLFNETGKGLKVKIGTENENETVNQCTIITASYELDGKVVGTVGVLGPTRMDYRRVMGMINQISSDMTFILNHIYRGSS